MDKRSKQFAGSEYKVMRFSLTHFPRDRILEVR
jgi:hypothetical protein